MLLPEIVMLLLGAPSILIPPVLELGPDIKPCMVFSAIVTSLLWPLSLIPIRLVTTGLSVCNT